VRAALFIGAYLASCALAAWAAFTVGDEEGSGWFVSTAVIHVAVALVGRRWSVLLLPLLFMAVLAVFDKLIYRSNGKGDCHDWCGDTALWAGFVIYWLPLALFACVSTLLLLELAWPRRRTAS
jgi:hypothetical protein